MSHIIDYTWLLALSLKNTYKSNYDLLTMTIKLWLNPSFAWLQLTSMMIVRGIIFLQMVELLHFKRMFQCTFITTVVIPITRHPQNHNGWWKKPYLKVSGIECIPSCLYIPWCAVIFHHSITIGKLSFLLVIVWVNNNPSLVKLLYYFKNNNP